MDLRSSEGPILHLVFEGAPQVFQALHLNIVFHQTLPLTTLTVKLATDGVDGKQSGRKTILSYC